MKFQSTRRPHRLMRGRCRAAAWSLAFAMLATFIPASALAQMATIAGSLTDRYGVAVPRAPVTARDTATQTVYSALANDEGRYSLTGLPPGTYVVSIEWIAFRKFQREDIVLARGQNRRLDIRLEDGETLNTPGELYFRHAAGPPPKGPTPRGPDGHPDFSGLWLPAADPHPEPPEILPAAAAVMKQRATAGMPSPRAFCLPSGIVRTTEFDLVKFVQTPKLLVMLVEGGDPGFRQIFLDGKGHPPDLFPTWLGHSTGVWKGDTLVVDTIGFNDRVWLSFNGPYSGLPQSEAMHIVERIRRPSLGQLETEFTIDDPGVLARPWKVRRTLTLAPGEEIREYICNENNRDPQHMGNK
jgi:hypothetical protein